MRVALLADFDPYMFRGLERPLELGQYRLSPALNLARGFRELGVKDIHYVVSTAEVKHPTIDDGPFGVLHRVPKPKFSGSVSFFVRRRQLILRELQRIQPDIVHGHGTEEQYALTAVTSPYPHVITFHGLMHRVQEVTPPPLFSLNHVSRWGEKIVLRKAREVICISGSVEKFLRERNSAARCHRIANAVAPCFFEVQAETRPADEPRLLFVGTIIPLKGLLHLIEAMALAEHRLGRNVKLSVIGPVGGGKTAAAYEATVRRRAEELRLGERIEWLGVQNERGIADALSTSDALVLPSFEETFGMCVAEAMAAGVPVVASRAGAIPELVEHGVTGLLVTPGNAAELADALCKVLLDVELRQRMVTAARAQAVARYRPRVVAEQTLAVYEMICRETSQHSH